MVNKKTKRLFLEELAKYGNVLNACLKTGISRATFYRWKKKNKQFADWVAEVIRNGRENMCDLAEQALLMNLRDKKMDAIRYVLSNNSPRYKPRRDSKVILEHRRFQDGAAKISEKTLEDLIREDEEMLNRKPDQEKSES